MLCLSCECHVEEKTNRMEQIAQCGGVCEREVKQERAGCPHWATAMSRMTSCHWPLWSWRAKAGMVVSSTKAPVARMLLAKAMRPLSWIGVLIWPARCMAGRVISTGGQHWRRCVFGVASERQSSASSGEGRGFSLCICATRGEEGRPVVGQIHELKSLVALDRRPCLKGARLCSHPRLSLVLGGGGDLFGEGQ